MPNQILILLLNAVEEKIDAEEKKDEKTCVNK